MPINNRGLQGQPSLPFVDFRSYAGADVVMSLTFLDQNGNPIQPTTISYLLDDITNFVNMIPPTSLTPAPLPAPQLLTIPGASLAMTFQYQGSQICQFVITATYFNSLSGITSTIKQVAVIELVAIQTVNAIGS